MSDDLINRLQLRAGAAMGQISKDAADALAEIERLRAALTELTREEALGSGMRLVVYGLRAQAFAQFTLKSNEGASENVRTGEVDDGPGFVGPHNPALIAPPSSLPEWSECALRVSNSTFIAKRLAEGGHGPEPDSLLATALHWFIYEYDDGDPIRSGWFRHRLEHVLKEARGEA